MLHKFYSRGDADNHFSVILGFLCFDGDVFDQKRLDFTAFNKILLRGLSIQQGRRFAINHQCDFALWVKSAHIPWVQFHKFAFSFNELGIGFSFHKSFSYTILVDPLSFISAEGHAQIDEIG